MCTPNWQPYKAHQLVPRAIVQDWFYRKYIVVILKYSTMKISSHLHALKKHKIYHASNSHDQRKNWMFFFSVNNWMVFLLFTLLKNIIVITHILPVHSFIHSIQSQSPIWISHLFISSRKLLIIIDLFFFSFCFIFSLFLLFLF